MSATTAVAQGAEGSLGVMVRTASQLHVYWTVQTERPVTLRVVDLSGRVKADLLDGVGHRDYQAGAGSGSYYVTGLPAGHLYAVELGELDGGLFYPSITAGPVQTPWAPSQDASPFPAPYHRS